MKTVWKYVLEGPEATVYAPARPQWLSAAIQDDQIVVWALVDTEEPKLRYTLIAVNTGSALPDIPIVSIGTVTASSGVVWHIFAEGRP